MTRLISFLAHAVYMGTPLLFVHNTALFVETQRRVEFLLRRRNV